MAMEILTIMMYSLDLIFKVFKFIRLKRKKPEADDDATDGYMKSASEK